MLRPVFCALLGLALLLVPNVSVTAAPRAAEASGVITGLRKEQHPVLLTLETDTGAITLKVTPKTEINVSPPPPPGTPPPGEGLDLLQLGGYAETTYDPRDRTVRYIGVSLGIAAQLRTGTLTGLDVFHRIGLNTDGDVEPDELLQVDLQSRLYLGPARISLAQLPWLVGMQVELLQSAGSFQVTHLRATVVEARQAVGRVQQVNLATGDLRVRTGTGVLSTTLASGAEITAHGDPVTPATLQPGDRVRLLTTPVPAGVVMALAVNLPDKRVRALEGTLEYVDPFESELKVRVRGATRTLTALPDAVVMSSWFGGPPEPSSLGEVAQLLGSFQRVRVRVEYVLVHGIRQATRIETEGTEIIPPPPPAGE